MFARRPPFPSCLPPPPPFYFRNSELPTSGSDDLPGRFYAYLGRLNFIQQLRIIFMFKTSIEKEYRQFNRTIQRMVAFKREEDTCWCEFKISGYPFRPPNNNSGVLQLPGSRGRLDGTPPRGSPPSAETADSLRSGGPETWNPHAPVLQPAPARSSTRHQSTQVETPFFQVC
jgi:hypothetical protein